MLKYISIKSVLYDLSLTMDEKFWDQQKMLEWAIKGFRKIAFKKKLTEDVKIIGVLDHSAKLPCDVVHVNQIAYKDQFTVEDLDAWKELLGLEDDDPAIQNHFAFPDNLPRKAVETFYKTTRNSWVPMRQATSSFIKAVKCQYTIPEDLNPVADEYYDFSNCEHEYHIDPELNLTTSLTDGIIMVSYLKYATDVDGDTLIPDDEVLKEAILHYCLYRYWLTRTPSEPQLARQERDWNLVRYQTLARRAAGRLSQPDIATLENIKAHRDRLVPRSKEFDNFFTTLNSNQSPTF